MPLWELSATEAARRLAAGEITSVDLVASCLERIGEADGPVQAWAYLDPQLAMAQAEAADALRQSGASVGPLAGIPIGIKDIFDTEDMPTECGTPVLEGRTPGDDAMAVSLLRRAGAVIMGKTVTAELANLTPGKTANPHDPKRTPGGSSSGSAAAVAANMVPLAIGSQTAGSTIRPATFCGVVGFKPTHGRISRRGSLLLSLTFDTVGVFARNVEDAALIADALDAYDPKDLGAKPRAPMDLSGAASSAPPLTPVLAFVPTAQWDAAEEDTKAAFGELQDFLGDHCECDMVELPSLFADAQRYHRTVMTADIAKNLEAILDRGGERLSAALREIIAEGQAVSAVDYMRARDMMDVLNAGLDEVFERYDAIITPGAPGVAPMGLETTGDPRFCTLWTFCGAPSISLPLLQGSENMPIGVQVVGERGGDGRLLRTARWLEALVAAENADEKSRS